ncbi:MAG: ExbD/TolR family protein [Candidatus Competibacteraceae bacterium]|jgi:biopolymer transport protein TolR|nr:MAG: ExbD/TolR family protein [Candidatus Competibacteraceae bacterium]
MARRSSHGRLKAEMNVVPYIDVMLVLLVIFMVAAPLLNQGVEVDLPQAQAEALDALAPELDAIILSITREEDCYLGVGPERAEPVACDTLEPRREAVGELLGRSPPPPVLVRADRDIKYDRVIQGMQALREVGAVRVGLSTAPPDLPPHRR